nr:zinc finger, CCHC-type [Tanacetum cinerariifolium]
MVGSIFVGSAWLGLSVRAAAENEGNDVPNGSRFSPAIEKIERLYMVCNMIYCDPNFTTKIKVTVIMTTGESVKDITSKFDKLAKFEGQDFRRWKKKMHFLLTTLKVVYVLSTPSPEWSENENLETTRKRMNTRPDIAFAIGKLSRYTSNPSALHWKVLGRVFQYLKGTMDYGLTYSGYPFVIEGYSNASWINNMEDHSSMSGWVFLLGGGAISWASKKQTCITSSIMESKFVALAAAGNEAEWLRNLVHEIPLWPKPISTISIRCDSAATMAKAYS